MSALTLEETETYFSIVASDRSTVLIYSDDPVLQRRIEAVGATLVKTEASGGKHYTLPAKQLTLRKPIATLVLSDAERAMRVERLAKARQSRQTTANSNAKLPKSAS